MSPPSPVATPQSHLDGTLLLLDRLESLAGGHDFAARLRSLVDCREHLPAQVAAQDNSLKYDVYIARGSDRWAWGLALNDRWEGDALAQAAQQFCENLGQRYPMHITEDVMQGLRIRHDHTFAVGFDHPERPPRLKFYIYEETWQQGVATPALLMPVLQAAAPGCVLPDWLREQPDRPIGVVAIDMESDGRFGLKIYLGGAHPTAITSEAPRQAQELARAMAESCPLGDSWYYLTIRLRPGEETRYSINKIYNHVRYGLANRGARLPQAWQEVRRLFHTAGQQPAFEDLYAVVESLPGLRVVPTATALEDEGRSADLYCAAFAFPSLRSGELERDSMTDISSSGIHPV